MVDYPKIAPIRSQTLRPIYEINYCAVAPNGKVQEKHHSNLMGEWWPFFMDVGVPAMFTFLTVICLEAHRRIADDIQPRSADRGSVRHIMWELGRANHEARTAAWSLVLYLILPRLEKGLLYLFHTFLLMTVLSWFRCSLYSTQSATYASVSPCK